MSTTPSTRRARPTTRRLAAAGVALWVVPLLACGSDADASSPAVPAAEAVAPTTTTPPPDRLDVVAEDFTWTGMPDHLPPGDYPLTLRNDGSEVHEIQVFRNPEGLDLPELFDLGPADMGDHVESAGGVLVPPGETSEETVLHLEEGTYEVVCFFPAASDQRPHFAHGMHQTLEVG